MNENAAAEILIKMSRDQLDTETAERLEAMKRSSKRNRRKAMKRSDIRSSRSSPYPMIERNTLQHGQRRHHGRLPQTGTALRSLIQNYSRSSSCWEKVLKESDVKGGQGRLLFNGDFAETVIYSMLKEGENPRSGVSVVVYDDQCREFKMAYKCWRAGDDKNKKEVYVLTSGWNEFHRIRLKSGETICRLKSGQTIYLWVFRHISTKRLCFAITTIQPE